MRTVELFYAYQFKSPHLPKERREELVSESVRRVNKKFATSGVDLRIVWKPLELDSGKNLYEQIDKLIGTASIMSVDLSDLNLNVLFEFGVAYGLSKFRNRAFMVLRHESLSIKDMPSDLSGLFIESYSEVTFARVFQKELFRAVNEYLLELSQRQKSQTTIPEIWGFDRAGHVDIVCSDIPGVHRPAFAHPQDHNYLRYASFADLDSLVHLKVHLTAAFPTKQFRDFPASEYRTSDAPARILIGGPAWNQKVRDTLHYLPFNWIQRSDEEDDTIGLHSRYGVSEEFSPQADSIGNIIRDVSVAARLTDSSGRVTHLFAGCLTSGVLGAARSLLFDGVGHDNARYVLDVAGGKDYAILFATDVLMADGMPPKFFSRPPLYTFVRDNSFAEFRLVVAARG